MGLLFLECPDTFSYEATMSPFIILLCILSLLTDCVAHWLALRASNKRTYDLILVAKSFPIPCNRCNPINYKFRHQEKIMNGDMISHFIGKRVQNFFNPAFFYLRSYSFLKNLVESVRHLHARWQVTAI